MNKKRPLSTRMKQRERELFPENLARLLIKHDMNANDLAILMKVSKGYISKIMKLPGEKGYAGASKEQAARIAKILGEPESELYKEINHSVNGLKNERCFSDDVLGRVPRLFYLVDAANRGDLPMLAAIMRLILQEIDHVDGD